MCLESFTLSPKIASEDIQIFKAVDKGSFNLYYTPCQRCLLREYPSMNIFRRIFKYNNKYYITWQGIHCYVSMPHGLAFSRYTIIKGIIPKGTKYWISIDGTEIASKYIKFEVSKKQRIAMNIRYFYLYLYNFIFKSYK